MLTHRLGLVFSPEGGRMKSNKKKPWGMIGFRAPAELRQVIADSAWKSRRTMSSLMLEIMAKHFSIEIPKEAAK